MKVPRLYDKCSISDFEALFLNENRKMRLMIGNKDNFWFLVKWINEDYELCTWENELIITRLDP
jgi:hypothetical protein